MPRSADVETNAMGRPRTFGPVQLAYVDSRQIAYNTLRKTPGKTQADVTQLLNKETTAFFAKFGWENPERTVPSSDIEAPAEEAVNERDEEGRRAQQAVKNGDANAEENARAVLIQHVRGVSPSSLQQSIVHRSSHSTQAITKRFQENFKVLTTPQSY